MANSITLAQGYAGIIDEVYQLAATSTVLNSDRGLARPGANAKEIKVPKVSVTGLGDYSRTAGYPDTGSVTFEFETRTFNYDRGCKIQVDAMDASETGVNDAFVAACSELQRTQVAPESDAFTYATIAGKTGIGKVSAGATLSDGAAVLKALRAGMNAMDNGQVPATDRYLFITPDLKAMVDDLGEYQSTVSKAVMTRFAGVVEVPQARFYTKIDLKDGLSTGDNEFGYEKASDGADINFLIVHRPAVIKFDKHVASRIFSPDELEDYDAYMQKYRKYGIVDVFDNKVAGVYLHHKAAGV